jgi:cell division protein FtsQ
MSPTDRVSRLRPRRATPRVTVRSMLVVAVAAVVSVGAWVVFFSSWLAVESVSVVGARTISVSQVEDAAHVPLGTPLARLDLNRIRAAVAQLPVVRTVAVHRSWPHTVAIAITERHPVASRYHAGTWQVLDSQGVAFRQVAARPPGLPVIAVSPSPDDLVAEAAHVAAVLPADLAAQTRRITASTLDSVELRLTSGKLVMWGSSAESDRKVEVLAALMVNAKPKQYDVSVPGQPTTSR